MFAFSRPMDLEFGDGVLRAGDLEMRQIPATSFPRLEDMPSGAVARRDSLDAFRFTPEGPSFASVSDSDSYFLRIEGRRVQGARVFVENASRVREERFACVLDEARIVDGRRTWECGTSDAVSGGWIVQHRLAFESDTLRCDGRAFPPSREPFPEERSAPDRARRPLMVVFAAASLAVLIFVLR